jgi:hypothetical protein
MRVTELTKEFAIIDGSRVDFEEPLDELPTLAEFQEQLDQTKGYLESLLPNEIFETKGS